MNKRYDYIVEVEKFNPYHGKDGRFTSANSAASFTYRPGKGKAHDKAIADEKIKSNPYRYMTNDKIASELSRAKAESDREQISARMDADSSPAVKRRVDQAKKRVAELDEKIAQLEQAQKYFDKYGNDNTF